MNTKQVIIIRKDLKMRKGKMVSHGGHAVLKTFFDMGHFHTNETGEQFITIPLDAAAAHWGKNIFTKICVSVDSEQELLDIHQQALDANLPCSLIRDNGLTEFDGVHTYTAVAIGPARNDDIDKITSHLKLL